METLQTFKIEGRTLVQLDSTINSGVYKFQDVTDGEIYLYERCEIPEHYLSLVKRPPIMGERELSMYEIDQKIATLCQDYNNKRISRVRFDEQYKSLNKKRDAIARKK